MRRPHLVSAVVFLGCALLGLALAARAETALASIGLFFGAALLGAILSGWLFNRLATPDEKQKDLEDRVRNSDL